MQRTDLLNRTEDRQVRERIKETDSILEALTTLDEATARTLVSKALGSKPAAPFDLKGGRQARIFATSVTQVDGVPEPFASAFEDLNGWIRQGCESGSQIEMWGADDPAGS